MFRCDSIHVVLLLNFRSQMSFGLEQCERPGLGRRRQSGAVIRRGRKYGNAKRVRIRTFAEHGTSFC